MAKKQSLESLQIQLEKIMKTMDKQDKKNVLAAFKFAQKAHKNQTRKSGEPFIIHPLNIGLNLWKKYKNLDLLIAGLLHDTVEDNKKIDVEQVYRKFGSKIGFIVDALNKRESGFYRKKIKFSDRTERLIWAGIQDIRVLIIKLTDRAHNLETLHNLPHNKQVRMAFETQAIFYPLQKLFKNKSIEKIQNDFSAYVKRKSLKTPQAIKECLFNIFFNDFSRELYSLVYSDTNKIIWEINNLEWFEKLVKNKKLSNHIEIEGMRIEQNGNFQALFMVKKGHAFNAPGQLKASSIKE